ncbi:response regulator transcription factor [Chryseobacterium sp. C-71]|jgi:DNA-binding NarL/FixJ family response regulator|uniref:response regulator transcription factor n=1 Tax=Chryseobacterium sp. C-71 TaxID=2893882 RepID=UPI001E4C8902|nr:response regulator transcription factor [Chryseobacterium sp. C-71]UFH31121.1 response regulator transcription factor [Chryseobacterium sp. C-71]
MKIKIALVDDEQLILEGVKLLLSIEKSISVTITSNNGPDFLENLAILNSEEFPDIALIDIQMKPMDGFELVENLRQKYPALKIIILSSHYKSSILGYMVKLGVSAFLPKNSDKKAFIEAITEVHTKGLYFTSEDYKMLFSYMNNPPKTKSLFDLEDELSDREKEVVKLICEEMTNHEIAEKLFLSPRTIESHRQRILDKIGAKNTVGIVIYAVINDIYSLPVKL